MLFSIRSNASDRELVFRSPQGDYFTVELRGTSVQATQVVWAYPDAQALAQLFARLAAYERPWMGEECWDSMEGELSLSVTCSPLGEVCFSVRTQGAQGAPEAWQVCAALTTELGQLPKIAADAHHFFAGI